jgi:hypothetical protein
MSSIAGAMLVSDDDDESDVLPWFDIFQIKPGRCSLSNCCLPTSWCLHGMAVAINGNRKQILQFHMPIYEAQRHAAIVDASGVIPWLFDDVLQMLVWVFDHKPSAEECVITLEMYLLRLLQAGIYSHRSELPRSRHRNGVYVVKCWTDLMGWHEFERIVFEHCENLQENYMGIAHFLKASKNNLYSIWKPGEVPLEVIVKYRLAGRHLRIEDQDRHTSSLDQHGHHTENAVRVEELE